jgi:hypothetical protein
VKRVLRPEAQLDRFAGPIPLESPRSSEAERRGRVTEPAIRRSLPVAVERVVVTDSAGELLDFAGFDPESSDRGSRLADS